MDPGDLEGRPKPPAALPIGRRAGGSTLRGLEIIICWFSICLHALEGVVFPCLVRTLAPGRYAFLTSAQSLRRLEMSHLKSLGELSPRKKKKKIPRYFKAEKMSLIPQQWGKKQG